MAHLLVRSVFILQAAYFSLAFFSLLLKFVPMSWKTLKTYCSVQSHCSCQDTELSLKIRLWIAQLQVVVKCKPCLQFHSMINNWHFNKPVVYLIVTAGKKKEKEKKRKPNNTRCAGLFSCMVTGRCKTQTIGLSLYLVKNSALILKIGMTRIAFIKASNGSLSYDIESDQLIGETQSSNTSLQYRYPNELLRVKQKTNLYSALFCRYLA